MRTDVEDTEHTAELVSNALRLVQREIATATAARVDRDAAALTPLFERLAAIYDERARAVVEVNDLWELAHTVANTVMPGASSVLQAGYGGPLTRERHEAWRHRIEAAGLLETATSDRA